MSLLREKFRKLNDALNKHDNKLLVLDFSHFSPKNEKFFDINFRLLAKDSLFRCEYDRFIQDAINHEDSEWKKFKEGGGNQKWLVNFEPDLPPKPKNQVVQKNEPQTILKKRLENIEVTDDFEPQDFVNGFPYKKYYLPGKCLVIYAEEHGKAQSVVYLLLENKLGDYGEYDLTQAVPEALKEFDKELSALLLNEMVESLISEKYDLLLQAKATATRASIAAIINRNFSHHIGSHITYRATPKEIIKRLQKAEINIDNEKDKYRSIHEMEDKLTFYKNDRNEYVSSVDEIGSPFAYNFYQDIILPFIENSLIMDNIAKSEGVEWNKELTQSKLRIRVFIHEDIAKSSNKHLTNDESGFTLSLKELGINKKQYAEMYAIYNGVSVAEQSKDTLKVDELPYFKQCKSETDALFYNKRSLSTEDIEIFVPDALGSHAVYSILENQIRNVAKHGDKQAIQKADFFDIIFKIDPVKNDCENYLVEITSNIPTLSEDDLKPKGEKNQSKLQEIKDWLKESLTGDISAKGIADMRINANNLLFQDAMNLENHEQDPPILSLDKLPKEKSNSKREYKYSLSYKFCFKKTKRIILLDESNTFNQFDNDNFKSFGIDRASDFNWDVFLSEQANDTQYDFYEIAIVDAEVFSRYNNKSFDYAQKTAHPIDHLLKNLPNKILVFNVQEDNTKAIELIEKVDFKLDGFNNINNIELKP
ncbi:MAG: hypothetical protein PF590_08710, partial [Candidatus Delongbacteria bacterium]|nr:hypothetical protein [Candidatus Delongbacteria bacterium]